MKTFKVESSNVTKNNNYCNKLVAKTIQTTVTPFGETKTEQQETYYLFTTTPNTVGFEAAMEVATFDIVEKPFLLNKEDGTAETIQLKYLYPKR